MLDGFASVAVTRRNDRVESWHQGVVAVVEPSGRLVAAVGSPAVESFVRSAVKPVQALPLLLAGGRERFGLEPSDIALTCASHGGTEVHVERARHLLERGELTEADLRCGSHWPLDEAATRALRERREEPGPLHNNCSGKHAGMLLACRLHGWPTDSYVEADHPLQRRIRELVVEICGVPEPIPLALDGCSVPTFYLSVEALARLYAALAAPQETELVDEVARGLATVASAMTEAPEMVAGHGRFTSELMLATAGRVLGKEGAEGFYGAAVREGRPLGIAVKIADGACRCRDGVVIDVLRQLGALSAAEIEILRSHHRPELRNWNGLLVGEIVPEVDLTDPESTEPDQPARAAREPALGAPLLPFLQLGTTPRSTKTINLTENTMTDTRIRIAHSPDSDDAFMFYALTQGLLDVEGLRIEHVLSDIETLNQAAFHGTYDITALSIHGYAHLADRYQLMSSGASFGDGYGPVVVTKEPMVREDLDGLCVAIPGQLTSAHLALKLWQPAVDTRIVPFDEIMEGVKNGHSPAGVIIHEGQLTYEDEGLHAIVDLGAWWKEETGLPLPLGGNGIRSDLPEELKMRLCRLLRQSIDYALAQREEALDFALEYARGLEEDRDRADRFVGMYVNEWTQDYGEEGRRAVRLFLDRAFEAGFLPSRVEPEFVGE